MSQVQRKLTTILAADAAEYSRVMESDEVRTVGDLRAARGVFQTFIERHHGRIANTAGDGLIAEFPSVVEAVQCAVEIQQEISNQDPDLPDEHRMRFRIGINLGDVMVEGSDIYGDGVNIASRLQELAEPGGVVISGSVYEQVHNKLSLGFDSLGQQAMKNVAPVVSYRVTMSGRAAERHSFPIDEKPASRADTVAASPSGAPPRRDEYGWSTGLRSVADWWGNLPRPIAMALAVSGFLILINVFTGLHSIWFHWPVAGLLFFAVVRTVLRRRRASDRRQERPTSRE